MTVRQREIKQFVYFDLNKKRHTETKRTEFSMRSVCLAFRYISLEVVHKHIILTIMREYNGDFLCVSRYVKTRYQTKEREERGRKNFGHIVSAEFCLFTCFTLWAKRNVFCCWLAMLDKHSLCMLMNMQEKKEPFVSLFTVESFVLNECSKFERAMQRLCLRLYQVHWKKKNWVNSFA